jgi:fructose-bisphosphate aldolase class I
MTKSLQEIEAVARLLVAAGKGILAADESTATIQRRFEAIGLESTPETRRVYRELLFAAPGIEDAISGAILYDETLHQHAADGTPFPALLANRDIITGIKVDRGTVDRRCWIPFSI